MIQKLKEYILSIFSSLSNHNLENIDIEIPEPTKEVIGISFDDRTMIEEVRSAIYIVGREKFKYDLSYVSPMWVKAKEQFAFGELLMNCDVLDKETISIYKEN